VLLIYNLLFFPSQIPPHDPWMAERIYHQTLDTLKVERDKFSEELELIFEVYSHKKINLTTNIQKSKVPVWIVQSGLELRVLKRKF
jgi:hypothetical protein